MPEVVYQVEFQAPAPVVCADGTVATAVDFPPECTLEWDDGGQSLSLYPWVSESRLDQDNGIFVAVKSWQEGVSRHQTLANPELHADIRRLLGKRVRVTVEVLDG